MKCTYAKCEAEARYIVVIDGMQYPLCAKHFKRIFTAVTKTAQQKGSASLDEIPVKVKRGRITLARLE